MFYLFAILIGASRVYPGLHYPSAIPAGYVVGGAWLTICVIIKQILN
ncbi:phosphatase PAP2 family protein [Desulfoscipio gibsoniae]